MLPFLFVNFTRKFGVHEKNVFEMFVEMNFFYFKLLIQLSVNDNLYAFQISSLYFTFVIFSDDGKVPESTITQSLIGLSFSSVSVFSIRRTTSIPLITFPNTTCLPSSHSVLAAVMEN